MYAGKVKVIFIDPPYNTGSENWVYNDNVNSPMMREWLGKVVDKEDLTRHDKWLCMMMPRLKLLRELLSDDGAIFVSCDDNEHHHLRMLLDEVFGDSNFVANIVWQARKSVQNDTDISDAHNHIVVYAKMRRQRNRRLKEDNADVWYSETGFAMKPLPLDRSKFDNPDNDPRGLWKLDPFDAPNVRANLTYEIVNPNTGQVHLPPKGRCWRTSKEEFERLLSDGRIMFGKNGRGRPMLKVFWEEKWQYGEVETTWWGDGALESFLDRGVDQESASEWTVYGTTTRGSQTLQDIFGETGIFNNPKPVELVKHILRLASDKSSIILDSFAGSGTTAHAVLSMNKEDGGNRKFILVEMEDYADRITAERVRRVIRGVPNAKDKALREGLGGTFSYFELGQAIDPEGLLDAEHLPPYEELARYVFYTATGEQFDRDQVDRLRWYIGSTSKYDIYLVYEPDEERLRALALTIDLAESLGPTGPGRKRLVFAPACYLSEDYLHEYRIEFAQLPYEIYRRRG